MLLLPTYCSYEFLETLASSKVDLMDEANIEDNKSRLELAQLIFKGVYAKIDKSQEEINSLYNDSNCNPYLKSLLRSGVKRIAPAVEGFKSLDAKDQNLFKSISPFTQFFLANSKSLNASDFETNSGHLFYTLNNPNSYPRINRFQVESFKLNEPKPWSFINNYNAPHNSIVIVDPHLLKNEKNEHVIHLVKNLCPKKLKSKYWITLVTSKASVVRFPDKAGEKLAERFKWIQDELAKALALDFEVELVIYSKEDFHDRYIITNNFMIYSGYGFDLINNSGRGKKQTSWVAINHAKIQDSAIIGNEKPHYNTAMVFLSELKRWVLEKESFSTPNIINPLLM